MSVSNEVISSFLEGKDPQKYIVAIESTYHENKVFLVINDPIKGKFIEKHRFKPFVWMKTPNMDIWYGGDRRLIKKKMREYAVKVIPLNVEDKNGNIVDRLDDGFKYILQTRGSYSDLLNFVKEGGLDVYKDDGFLAISPIEQFLIQTGKRLFKGFDDYNELHRLSFDIETTSLNPDHGRIFQMGIKDNRGFEHVLEIDGETPEEINFKERSAIETFFKVIPHLKPDILAGYYSETFDWTFTLRRAELLGMDTTKIKTLGKTPLYRKKATLKMGAEMEFYQQTVMWGINIIDIWHAVRRAQAINSDIKEAGLKYITRYSKIHKDNRVYIPGDKISEMWSDTNNDYCFDDKTGDYYKLTETNNIVKENYEKVEGRYIVERYLLDDLWETQEVDYIFNQANFLLSKIVPSSFQRTSTMGTAALWKLLMLAWSYENGLAIPNFQKQERFTGGLSRLLDVGYNEDIIKLDFASLYPSIQLTHDVFPDIDTTGAMKGMLQYVYDARNKYKELKNEAKSKGDKKAASDYDKKQLPLKILNNSMFGSVSAPNVFPWGDMNVGEQITCTGRQYLRHMIKFFISKGYIPLVGDTDGFNFKIPNNINEIKYVGQGQHRFVEKDKTYIGNEAVVAEYNEKYMKKVMGLDIDEFCKSTINLARKNYANLMDDNKIKLVGNTIKSKKMPIYIEEFLDSAVNMLLNGEGKNFVEYYYEYVDKIFNQEIPLMKIASKSKVKMTINEYKKRANKVNKNGNPLPKQAHMELLIKEDITPNLGDIVYYVNTGTAKSHGDVQSKNNELIFNCDLIPKEQIENDPDLKGEYNIARYMDNFNKRIKPLLVCFIPEVRDVLLIKDPSDRQYFTDKQLELINGVPFKPEDQDNLDDLLTISEQEMKFWEKINIDPEYMFNEIVSIEHENNTESIDDYF